MQELSLNGNSFPPTTAPNLVAQHHQCAFFRLKNDVLDSLILPHYSLERELLFLKNQIEQKDSQIDHLQRRKMLHLKQ